MNSVIEFLEANGLEVQQIKVAVRCKTCHHDWQLRLMPYELVVGRSPNPLWSKCWVCRQAKEVGGENAT